MDGLARSLGAWRRLTVILTLLATLGLPSLVATAAGPEYRIGIDDVIGVSIYDQKELDQVVTVRPDGKISLQLVGEMDAAGLTVAELASRLTTQYARTVRGAQVSVSVREIRSRPVFFPSNVVRPGTIQLIQDLTILQGLSQVGGALPTADLESAYVLRGTPPNQTRIPVNLQAMLQKGDHSQNIKLQPGDTVVLPNAGAVYIQGEVRVPGQVKFTQGMTVTTAIAGAGGLTPLASGRRVTIARGEGAKRQILQVNVDKILSDPDTKDVPLVPNDVITVPQRLF
jgi:polysaccharide biosynthesis/export protein